LLAANLIAHHRHLPLADFDSYLQGRLLAGCERLNMIDKTTTDIRAIRALVVQHSIHSGQTLRAAKEHIRAAGLEQSVVCAVIFVDPNSIDKVDFYFKRCPMPRIFE